MMEEEKKSGHKVEVVELVLEKHPAADRLSVARVFGYSCCVNTEQWAGHTKAAYIPPDSLVDVSRPEFAFLAPKANADGKVRIKAMKLRGVLSFGLLVPVPEDAKIGDDLADYFGVTHYDPPMKGASNPNRGGLFASGEVDSGPNIVAPKYDLESGRRYAAKVFQHGEMVYITEKLHGANARYCYFDGKMYCGSRTEWKKEYPSYDHVTVESLLATGKVAADKAQEIVDNLHKKPKVRNLWWQALDATPSVRAFCEANPGVVLYGEVLGVQDLPYGLKKGECAFRAFDILANGLWMDAEESMDLAKNYRVPWVPIVYHGSYDFDTTCEMAEGKSLIADHIREGVVVRPLKERYNQYTGRSVLKWVGAGYLER